jgi:hypothetical protein
MPNLPQVWHPRQLQQKENHVCCSPSILLYLGTSVRHNDRKTLSQSLDSPQFHLLPADRKVRLYVKNTKSNGVDPEQAFRENAAVEGAFRRELATASFASHDHHSAVGSSLLRYIMRQHLIHSTLYT